jgi:hypothetical protein
MGGNPHDPQLIGIRNIREYQLTLRNTSTVHLQDVEIQFEFTAGEVEEYASPRTTISKTALIKSVNAPPPRPSDFPTLFRWTIPQFPSGDSVDFSFQAVNPPRGDPSESYVASLYKSPSVVVEKVEGEPAPRLNKDNLKRLAAIFFAVGAALGAVSASEGLHFTRLGDVDKFTVVKDGGCNLRIVSTYNRYEQDIGTSIRWIRNDIFNAGQGCVVKSDELDPKRLFTIGAGESVEKKRLSAARPALRDTEVLVGPTESALKKVIVPLYVEQ